MGILRRHMEAWVQVPPSVREESNYGKWRCDCIFFESSLKSQNGQLNFLSTKNTLEWLLTEVSLQALNAQKRHSPNEHSFDLLLQSSQSLLSVMVTGTVLRAIWWLSPDAYGMKHEDHRGSPKTTASAVNLNWNVLSNVNAHQISKILTLKNPPNISLRSLHQLHVEITIFIYRVNMLLFNNQNMGQHQSPSTHGWKKKMSSCARQNFTQV